GPAAASPTPPTTPESSPPAIIAPAAVQKAPPRQDAAPQCPACGDVSMTAYHSGPLKTYYRCPECGRTDQRIRSAVLVQLNRRGRV
ncbi:MAG TPA: hypothetical protein VGE52_19915, partial [Pirellulales bacterium]